MKASFTWINMKTLPSPYKLHLASSYFDGPNLHRIYQLLNKDDKSIAHAICENNEMTKRVAVGDCPLEVLQAFYSAVREELSLPITAETELKAPQVDYEDIRASAIEIAELLPEPRREKAKNFLLSIVGVAQNSDKAAEELLDINAALRAQVTFLQTANRNAENEIYVCTSFQENAVAWLSGNGGATTLEQGPPLSEREACAQFVSKWKDRAARVKFKFNHHLPRYVIPELSETPSSAATEQAEPLPFRMDNEDPLASFRDDLEHDLGADSE